MGVTKFQGVGEIADAGFGDGISGKVNEAMKKLPKDVFFWMGEETGYTPYAEHKGGVIVIDVRDTRPGNPALGVNVVSGMNVSHRTEESTEFSYDGTIYRVHHKTVSDGSCRE